MKRSITMNCVLIYFIMSSLACATSKDSTLLGIGVGSVIGASIGASFGAANGHAKEGAAVGALALGSLGGLAGYYEHKRQQEQKGFLPNDPQKDVPAMTMPQVRRVWVPDQIEDGRYIQGHFVYIIDKQSNWMLNENKETNNGINNKQRKTDD